MRGAGSYAASVLAHEGIDTTLLEADTFPQYHIGESLLLSMHYFLDFINLYDKFNDNGFLKKVYIQYEVFFHFWTMADPYYLVK